MSKKTNTILFMLGATAANIIITIVCFFVLFIIFARFVLPYLPEEAAAWGLPVCFVGGIVLAFFVYRFIIKQIQKKVDFEENFDPLFGPRKRK